MSWASDVVLSSIGRKVIMAVTGLILFGFVIAHMIGNLQAFLGPVVFNDYAVWLRSVLHGAGLWIARFGLLVAVVLHIWAATSLTRQSWTARPVGYRERRYVESSYASRTMRWSGVLILLFVVYHLMHFTFGNAHPSFRHGDAYHNFVAGFQVPLVSAFYVVAMLALGFHLWHGSWSMLQTLGLSHPRYNRLRFGVATLVTALVVVGNITFPLAVLAGVIHE